MIVELSFFVLDIPTLHILVGQCSDYCFWKPMFDAHFVFVLIGSYSSPWVGSSRVSSPAKKRTCLPCLQGSPMVTQLDIHNSEYGGFHGHGGTPKLMVQKFRGNPIVR